MGDVDLRSKQSPTGWLLTLRTLYFYEISLAYRHIQNLLPHLLLVSNNVLF